MLKQEKLSPKLEAAAYTLSLELYAVLLSCLTSATPENSQNLSSQCAADTKDAASGILDLAVLLT